MLDLGRQGAEGSYFATPNRYPQERIKSPELIRAAHLVLVDRCLPEILECLEFQESRRNKIRAHSPPPRLDRPLPLILPVRLTLRHLPKQKNRWRSSGWSTCPTAPGCRRVPPFL